jgi:hypothetical protein
MSEETLPPPKQVDSPAVLVGGHGAFQAVQPSNLGCTVVSEVVWMPEGNFCFLASPNDGPAVGILGILFTCLSFWIGFPRTVTLAGCHWGLSLLPLLGSDLIDGFPWAEYIGFAFVRLQEQFENGLRLGANGDTSNLAVMLVLVGPGLVDPNIVGHIQVTSPKVAYILRPHARQFLNLNHGSDVSIEARARCLKVIFWHRFDRLGLSGNGTASLQPFDGPQPMVDRRRNEALLSAPPEDAFDSRDSPVYGRPGQPRLNH